MVTMLEHALSYAERGWPVLPLHAVVDDACTCHQRRACKSKGKHPWTTHGLRDATADPEVIRGWFQQRPRANLGVLTGRASGILAVDVDAKSGGLETLADLTQQHGDLPETAIQDTGGGGQHYLFRYPEGREVRSKSSVARGIDVRGDRGYIVVAPSVHESGRAYRFRDPAVLGDLPDAPAWLLELCGRDARRQSAPRPTHRAEPIDVDRVEEALLHVDPDDRGNWLRVGAALKHELGDAGRAIWDRWSSGSAKFDPADQDRTWESLRDHEDPAGLGTIFHLAKQAGWEPRRRRPADRQPPDSEPAANGDGTFELTDCGNAERFAGVVAAKVKFCKGIGWLAWDGHRWTTEQSADVLVQQHANHLVKRLHAEAADAANSARYSQLLGRAKRAASRCGIDAILALASKDARLMVHSDQLDSDPLLLNCPNGIVDLRSGRLLEHDPKHLMTHLAGAGFDPHAQCPKWLQTLGEVFAGDDRDEVIDFVHRAVGYTLTGLTKEEVFFMLFGDGRNGKGTIVDQVRKVMGSYAHTASTSLFLSQKHDGGKQFELAGLKGARMVNATEAGADQSFDTAIVKAFTGSDRRKACFKHKPHFEYLPTDKLWLQVNDKPSVPSWDTAFQERCRLLPFLNQFTAEKGNLDRNRKADLELELPGILAWAVRGCVRYLKDGLRSPDRVKVAVEEYRTENTRVEEFLEQHFKPVTGSELQQSRIYAFYRSWCRDQGRRPVPENRFGSYLTKAGYITEKDRAGRRVCGIGVLEGVSLPSD